MHFKKPKRKGQESDSLNTHISKIQESLKQALQKERNPLKSLNKKDRSFLTWWDYPIFHLLFDLFGHKSLPL